MIKIAVCDDLPMFPEYMKRLIEGHEFMDTVEVDGFTNGDDLFKRVLEKRYDIIFMDIELVPGDEKAENGMGLSNRIKAIYSDVLMIFFTGSVIDTRQLLSFEPFRFIAKPIQEKEVFDAVQAGIERIHGWEDKFYRFKTKDFYAKVNLKNVYYLASKWPYIDIYTVDDTFEFRGKMDNVQKELEELSEDFVRINKSYLVNRAFVKGKTSREVVMRNGDSIPVGRAYSKELEKL